MPVLGPGYMARNVDGIDANIERYGGEGRHRRWVWVLRLSIAYLSLRDRTVLA
jgi:hypothetical protein